MVLCNLCASIPFNDLPQLPSAFRDHMTRWDLINDYNVMPELKNKWGGLSHQPDLSSLRSSARECELCRLILVQVELVISQLDKAIEEDIDFQTYTDYRYPTFDLCLAKRRVEGPGFLVLCNSASGTNIYLVAAIGLCAKDGDALAPILPGRMVEQQLGSQTLERAASWLHECDRHPGCASASNFLPKRVVDVGDGRQGDSVRLVEPPSGTHERYAALSHCWGHSGLPMTTKANKTERMKAIGLDEMSRSFKDAIYVTRYLGIRYIWIDSLCICQDDQVDWSREAAKMNSVYSNAFLTISIMGAEDSSIGAFGRRKERRYVRLPYTHTDGTQGYAYAFSLSLEQEYQTEKYVSMNREPVSNRGWCFQERVLSRRILHFARDQMYFECMQGIRNEEGLFLSERFFTVHGSGGDSLLYNGGSSPATSPLDTWYGLVWNYCDRKLTKGSDKLPALGGITEIYAGKLDDQCLAGIWRKSLIEGLMWEGLAIEGDHPGRAPSWSWASCDTIPGHSLQNIQWKALASIFDCDVELASENPFGEVNSGCIKMEAPLLSIILTSSHYYPNDPQHIDPIHPKFLNFRTAGSDVDSTGRLDFAGQKHVEIEAMAREQGSVFALVLAADVGYADVGDAEIGDANGYYYCLLVTPLGDKRVETVKRIGFLRLMMKSVGTDIVRSSRTILTLV